MSAVGDFFQNLGSVLTFGLIPPAMPDMPELSEEDLQKITGLGDLNPDKITSDVNSIFKSTSIGDFNPDEITNNVSLILKSLNLGDLEGMDQPDAFPTDSPPNTYTPNTPTPNPSPPDTYTPPKTYIPNNPMNPYK